MRLEPLFEEPAFRFQLFQLLQLAFDFLELLGLLDHHSFDARDPRSVLLVVVFERGDLLNVL